MASLFYFHAAIAQQVLDAIQTGKDKVKLSLDLNLSHKVWPIVDDCLVLDEDQSVSKAALEEIVRYKAKIFVFQKNRLHPLEIRKKGYVKLVPTKTAPTLEIDGVKMHRSKTIDVLEDAAQKVQAVVKPGARVLDTCGGLGYSAAWALKAGAQQVISVEKSPEVIQIREQNPWLKSFNLDGLELIHGNIIDVIETFENLQFDSIIHDPPRFSSATGDLYGKAFYTKLFEVMARGAKLFHYTGSPRKIKNGSRFVNNTLKRLEACGFGSLEFIENLQGISGEKSF